MDETQALQRLQQILARPEFQASQPTLWDVLQRRLTDWVHDTLWQFVLWVRAAAAGQEGWYGLGVLVVGLIIAGVLVAYLVRAIRLTLVPESGEAARRAAERRERSDHLWRQAHRLAAEARFAEAVRALYLSALYALEEHAVLRVQDSLTNREHAARVAARNPDLRQAFAGLVERYDRLRYGGGAADQQAFDELRALVAQTRTLTA